MNIDSIGVAPTTPRSLVDCLTGADTKTLELLQRDGYSGYRTSELGIAELAADSIRSCLSLSEINPMSVDGVIVVTESFWATGAYATCLPGLGTLRESLSLTVTTELPNAFCYGSWLAGCANLTSSFMLADALLRSGRHCNIMVVFADRVHPGNTRVAQTSVFSDVGLACILSQRGKWKLNNILGIASPELIAARLQKDVLLQGRALINSLKALSQKLERTTGLHIDDFDIIVSDNLGKASLDLAARSIGIHPDRIVVPTRSTHAHCFSVDCLLSLIPASELVEAGKKILLLNVGPCSQGAAVIEKL